MKMEASNDRDRDRSLQEELDAMSLDDPVGDELSEGDEDGYPDEIPAVEIDRMMHDTREQLERAMQERLAAFENEINVDFKRYEIDYSEIDEMLHKPIENSEDDIQINVARHCGIERDELDRVRNRHSINSLGRNSSLPCLDSATYQCRAVTLRGHV